MKTVADHMRFDPLQQRLLQELVGSIRDGLREAGITDEDALYEATGNLAFSVCAIVDGSRVMDLEGSPVVPVLTFASGDEAQTLITAASGGSWMHESVFGVVDELFEGEDEDED